MELRGTVLNVVDFGAFVDVGLSDSGLVHISQLSAGYVRDPHDVVAVGDQVRVWVASIDKERRRVALTMIAPGTERPKPAEKPRRGPRRRPQQQAAGAGTSVGRGAGAGSVRKAAASRTATSGARASVVRRGSVAIAVTNARSGPVRSKNARRRSWCRSHKAMEEGKEAMRTFGDLLQFVQKKNEPKSQPAEKPAGTQDETVDGTNGSS